MTSVRPGSRIKGAGFRELLRWQAHARGPASVRATAERLPADRRLHFDLDDPMLGVIASAWYSAPAIHAYLDVLVEGISDLDRAALAFEIARFTREQQLSGVFGEIFEPVATRERYPRFATVLWRRYYESGEIVIEDLGKGIRSTCKHWLAHHPLLCDIAAAWGRLTFESMGLTIVAMERARCIGWGDLECSGTVWFEAP